MAEALNEIGRRHGRLVVLSRAPNYVSPRGKMAARWNCVCDCGTKIAVSASNLRTRTNISCGCLNKEMIGNLNLKHGGRKNYSVSPELSTYRSMIARCYHKSMEGYQRYGAKGIGVCERWRGTEGFVNFLADMGPRPQGHTLDRFPDNAGNYHPMNCRWATVSEQNKNRARYKHKRLRTTR